jgi:hypothetical protein
MAQETVRRRKGIRAAIAAVLVIATAKAGPALELVLVKVMPQAGAHIAIALGRHWNQR